MKDLLPYAETAAQKSALQAIIDHGSIRSAARALDLSRGTVQDHVKAVQRLAAGKGYSPDHDMTHTVPDGFNVRGVSTLYNQDGEVSAQWVKSDQDKDRQLKIVREALEGLIKSMPKFARVAKPKCKKDNLMNVIPWGDPHFGMYSWEDETGANFDLDIAKRDLCGAADYLIDRAPQASRLLFANLGDFFHADNLLGMTSRSGNVLDMDTRLPHVYQVGVSAIIQCINSGLKKFQTIEIVNAPGNHDDVLSMTLSVLLSYLYEREPRVVVHNQPTSRHYIQHGKVLVGVVHGHATKDRDLPGLMAAERPKLWGETTQRYWYRGHHHHDAKEEYHGCLVEQFRTLAAPDAYATEHGYYSGRDMKCITHHAEYGEVERLTCNLDMLTL